MSARRSSKRQDARGGVLVEFALVSLALYLLLAAVIGLGRWMATVQSAQDAVRVAAREIALYPLPAQYTFAQALEDPGFRQAVYSPDFLVVDLDENEPGPDLDAAFAAMPVVNRALRPLMITSSVEVGDQVRRLLHMPGVLTDSSTSPTLLTVVVPRIDERNEQTGAELEAGIVLLPVLEELGPGSFSVATADRGLVAVRLNVPYQSATLSAYLPTTGPVPGVPFNQPVQAIDPDGGGYRIVGPGPDGTGPYSGTYGLGEHLALGGSVRPFRRLIAAQAIFRREVFL